MLMERLPLICGAKYQDPSSASILNAGSANSIQNGLAEGTPYFSAIVTDNAGAKAP